MKPYRTSEYRTRARAPVSRLGNYSVIVKLALIQRVTKIIKSIKDYSCRERLKKFGLTIGIIVKVFINGSGERGIIPGRVIPKQVLVCTYTVDIWSIFTYQHFSKRINFSSSLFIFLFILLFNFHSLRFIMNE